MEIVTNMRTVSFFISVMSYDEGRRHRIHTIHTVVQQIFYSLEELLRQTGYTELSEVSEIMKLVMNGDDLGYTLANTLGIIEAYRNGIVRSTTAMVNMPYIEQAVRLTEDCTDLGIGVHLVLTAGRPLTQNRTLTDENGSFLKQRVLRETEVDTEEVYTEWKAQIERFRELFGRMPTHIDSHHGVHSNIEKLRPVVQRLGREYGLEIRYMGKYKLVNGFYEEGSTKENLMKILSEHPDEEIEIMCHPGFCDLELYRNSSYSLQRVKELDILCSDELKNFVAEHQIELIHY